VILLDKGKIAEDGPSHQVASKYLDSGLGRVSERKWSTDSPKRSGNNMVALQAVRVRNEAGVVSDIIDIRECVKVEVEYLNFAHDRFPYVNVQLINEDGICLFTSGDFVNQEWRHQPRDFTGKIVSTCTIPGNFLAEGRINVTVALTTHKPIEVLRIEQDAVSFVVLDQSQGDGARGEYPGQFPGLVRPILDWQINYERSS
jgi:lipopolysaccharide transport system ATP-binding protein